MVSNNKSILLAIITLLMLLLFGKNVIADDYVYEANNGLYVAYVSDRINLLSQEEVSRVLDSMRALTEYGNVAFVSTENGGSAVTEAKSYGSSLFGTGSYLVLVIDMNSRDLGVYVNGSYASLISKGRCDTLVDNAYRLASNRDYAGCAIKIFNQAYAFASGNSASVSTPMKITSNIMLALVLSLLVNYGLVKILHGNRKMSVVKQAEFGGSFVRFNDCNKQIVYVDKKYSPQSKGSSGGGHGGGGGGHGGGHHF